MKQFKFFLLGIIGSIPQLKSPILWLRFGAYFIPFSFLIYVLYLNFLPFGYDKIFTIQVGSATDTTGQFYIEPSPNLSERKTDENGMSYRELNGVAYATFEPSLAFKKARVSIEINGEGIQIDPTTINFDKRSINWRHVWTFSNNVPLELTGDAFYFDNGVYFDGESRLELPNSGNLVEGGPFTIYAEWLPRDDLSSSQEIVGHYNWEIFQNRDSISFQVGRMSSSTGPFYTVRKQITNDFFNKRHQLIAIYSPATTPLESGYIELYIDNSFADKTFLGQQILWKDYGNKNITFGKSDHGVASYFNGFLYDIRIIEEKIQLSRTTDTSILSQWRFALSSTASSSLDSIILHVKNQY